MALTNTQYAEIMRGYDKRQLQNRHRLQAKQKRVFAACPRLAELEKEISSCSLSYARKRLAGDPDALNGLKQTLADLREEKTALLASLGLPADYLTLTYTCPDCRDTGLIGQQKCHCFRQAVIDTVYAQSHIREILARENFDSFTLDYYSDTQVSPITGLTARQTAENARKECRRFIDDFDSKPKNLLFYGGTGVGKTFLSNCVARELLEKSYSVIYFTAFQLFDIFSKGIFDKEADAIEANRQIFDCDLLIIDDLGTELSNAFTSSQLFLCLNERILRNKSTIISTNLGMNQLLETYSERSLSRILSNYTVIKLFGDDIRLKKRRTPNAK